MMTPDAIKQIRSRGHVTQQQLALLLDVSPQTVSNWESGRNKPSIYAGAILIRLHTRSRDRDFHVWLPSAAVDQELLRDQKVLAGLRMHSFLEALFANSATG